MNTNVLFKILISLFIIVIIFPSITSASEFKAGDKLVIMKDEVVNDDIYFSGNSVIVDGTINGDLVAAGGSIIVTGNITDDIRAAGGEVRIDGDVCP